MKKLTMGFSICLIFMFLVSLVFVSFSKDFEQPKVKAEESNEVEVNENSPVWNKSYDELITYFEENGLIDSKKYIEISDGVATTARKYNGAEIYWWDINNLAEGSDEYIAYESLKNDGYIDIYGTGNIMSPEKNGPFAVLITRYEGDSDKLSKVFKAFGK